MSASAAYSLVEKMLKNCAPGYTVRQSTHSRVIQYSGKVYRSFPGSKFDNIEYGHIRKLVRFLGIADCAAKQMPSIIKAETKPPDEETLVASDGKDTRKSAPRAKK